jgi:hypothetical protein
MKSLIGMEQVESFAGMKKLSGCAADELADCHELAEKAWSLNDRGIDKRRGDKDNSGLVAFAYMWRRFGPPLHGTDPYKKLCCYYLTTEDPDIFLGIDISASGLAYSACYMANGIREAHYANQKPWFKLRKKWDNKYEEWWKGQNPQFSEIFKKWNSLGDDEKKPVWEKYSDDEFDPKVSQQAYKAIGKPAPRNDDTPTARRVKKVLLAAMKELLRPVHVRDVSINILGQCDEVAKPAKPSKYAGYGVPKKAMDLQLREEDE